jgi:hypothetical protein
MVLRSSAKWPHTREYSTSSIADIDAPIKVNLLNVAVFGEKPARPALNRLIALSPGACEDSPVWYLLMVSLAIPQSHETN